METLLHAVGIEILVVAAIIILIMGFIPEPHRQSYNAIFVAGAGAAYLNGGFGLWEFAFIGVASVVAFLGLRHYFWIGLAWVLHTVWDVAHHLYGNPIWHWAADSSAGCAALDLLLAAWFFAGAPSFMDRFYNRKAMAHSGEN